MAALLTVLSNFAICQEYSAAAFKDEIFARKILMDTIDNHADTLDWMLTGGKRFDFERAVGGRTARAIPLAILSRRRSCG